MQQVGLVPRRVARELLALSSAIDELENYKLAQFITGLADIMKETDHGR